MGWWKIKDIKTGQIDFEHKNSDIANAIPGKETEDNLYNGDGPSDLMGDVLNSISKQYSEAWGRPVKKEELTAVFNFVVNGRFS